MTEVQWIKIKVGLFDGTSFKRIKRAKIGGIEYRDKLTAVWFELLDLGAKCNNGGKLYSDEIPYGSIEDIATMIDRTSEEVSLCLEFYKANKMIEIVDDVYALSNWSKYQNEDKLEAIRRNARERQQRFRDSKKLLLEQANECNVTDNVTDNVTVTQNTSYILNSNNINISDNDVDSNKSVDSNNINNINNNIIIKEVIDYLNTKADKHYKYSTANSVKHISARLKEGYTLEDFKYVIDIKCEEWKGTNMEQYLRPETLFSPKFEGYLNQKRINQNCNKSNPNALFDPYSEVEDWHIGRKV